MSERSAAFLIAVSATLAASALLACSSESSSPAARPDNTPTNVPPTSRPTETPPPTPSTVRRGVDRELVLGRNDGLEIESTGISFAGSFGIAADVKPTESRAVALGDTVVSKGNNFAFYARSPNPTCLTNVGALINGEDYCGNIAIEENSRVRMSMSYDGRVIQVFVNGVEAMTVQITGPLQESQRNIYVGRRRSLEVAAPLVGTIDNLIIVGGKSLVVDFNNDNLTNFGGRNVRIIGDARTGTKQ